jgi:hypothetical protein
MVERTVTLDMPESDYGRELYRDSDIVITIHGNGKIWLFKGDKKTQILELNIDDGDEP